MSHEASMLEIHWLAYLLSHGEVLHQSLRGVGYRNDELILNSVIANKGLVSLQNLFSLEQFQSTCKLSTNKMLDG